MIVTPSFSKNTVFKFSVQEKSKSRLFQIPLAGFKSVSEKLGLLDGPAWTEGLIGETKLWRSVNEAFSQGII